MRNGYLEKGCCCCEEVELRKVPSITLIYAFSLWLPVYVDDSDLTLCPVLELLTMLCMIFVDIDVACCREVDLHFWLLPVILFALVRVR